MLNPILSSVGRCKDCHSCIRVCPVKAIRLRDGQAVVVEERCIACGNCVTGCSQNAKTVTNDVELIEQLMGSGPVVASLAPSFPAAFPDVKPEAIFMALKQLGFSHVEETALAVPEVAAHYAKELLRGQQTGISACCPVIVNLIEIYFPELIPSLSTSLSPMVLHSKQLTKRSSKSRVVFIGPCIGKKQEAERAGGAVSAVLTFLQLEHWLTDRRISLENQTAEKIPHIQPQIRRYPLHRGVLQAAGIDPDSNFNVLSVDGLKNCIETFEDIRSGRLKPGFVEALACEGGCIGGPGMPGNISLPRRKSKVVQFAVSAEPGGDEPKATPSSESRQYLNRKFEVDMPTDEEIRAILSKVGKNSPEDETNCGGCGYRSCRDKAIAVYHGLAEIEMCIPYMRARIESVAQVVVETTRNGIIVVDSQMMIQDFNPAANRMLNRRNKDPKGQHLSCFIDPGLFKTVWETEDSIVDKRVAYEQYDIVTRQTIYPLKEYQLVIGVFTDITAEEERLKANDQIYDETLEKASRVIHHQMKVAQDIAGLLGETTADTKATLLELVSLMKERSRRR